MKVVIQSGSAATGWKEIEGSYYYFNLEYANMITGWEQIDGIWYYFKKDGDGVNWSGQEGSMLHGDSSGNLKVWITDKEYEFDSNGHCLNP